MQQHVDEDLRGVFGIEGDEEMPEKRQRVESAHDSPEGDEDGLEESGVFEDSDDGDYKEFHASGARPGVSGSGPSIG